MKKLLLLLACIAFLLPISAQDSIKKKVVASPTIEATGSINVALYNRSQDIQKKALYSCGLLLGADFKLPHGVLMLQTGILVSNHDFLFQLEGERDFKSLFLDVPITLGYAYRASNKFSVSFSTGLIIRNLLKYETSVWFNPPFEILNRNTQGVYGAIGFWYHASPHFVLRVEPFFEYFFTPYKSVSGEGIAKNLTAPVLGLKIALKCNILKLDSL